MTVNSCPLAKWLIAGLLAVGVVVAVAAMVAVALAGITVAVEGTSVADEVIVAEGGNGVVAGGWRVWVDMGVTRTGVSATPLITHP